MKCDVVIVGTGLSGLYASLKLREKNIILITKSKLEESNSFLAQGGICVLKDKNDYNSFFSDTLKAGHSLNDKKSIRIMINKSTEVIRDLIKYNVLFEKENNTLKYTKEGSHSTNRILYHKDITGKEITSKLITKVKKHNNITILENTEMINILDNKNTCYGIVVKQNNNVFNIKADYTIFATGGIGGLFNHSTNYSHIKGDSLNIALNKNIDTKDIDYIQIHPTTFYSKEKGRRFLLTESLRGEGAILLNKNKERFTNELNPRDIVTKDIYNQMKKDKTDYVYLSLEKVNNILEHFPNIYNYCLKHNIDITKDLIPVVPSQHYHMGGIKVDYKSRTSMKHLYAIGEVSCNGVHGKNRLASNSLLESLVFSKIAATDINNTYKKLKDINIDIKEVKNILNIGDKND